MSLSQAQIARNALGARIRNGSPAATIERARSQLEYAKAEQAITSWTALSPAERARLAIQLLAGVANAG